MYYVMSDIHGCINQFDEAIKKWDVEKERLVILGDLIDRGPDPFACLNLTRKLEKEYGAIILKGNHEEMFVSLMKNLNMANLYYMEDFNSTIDSFRERLTNGEIYPSAYLARGDEMMRMLYDIKKEFQEYINYMDNLPLYHDTEYTLFVHAGIDLEKELDDQGTSELLYIRSDFYNSNIKYHKQIVFGHTPTRILHEEKITNDDIWVSKTGEKVGIDGCCFKSGQLNVVKINNGKIFKSLKFQK